jgi:hypothetical protein
MAAVITLRLFDGETPDIKAPTVLNAVATTAELFQLAGLEKANDWFTIHKLLGQPSATACLDIAAKLSEVQILLKAGDHLRLQMAMDALQEDALTDMLENYINATNHQNPKEHTPADGWAYVLWSSDEPDGVVAAVTELTIDEAIADIKTPKGHPVGVLAAWQVYRPNVASEVISALLSDLRLAGDLHVAERGTAGTATLGVIKDSIEAILIADELLVRSPWHFDVRLDNIATDSRPPHQTMG